MPPAKKFALAATKKAATPMKSAAPKKAAAPAKKAASAKKIVPAKAPPQVSVTLKQIAAELAEGHDLSKKVAEAVMGDFVRLATRHLQKGDKIRLTGLGILQVREREARMGRNPATGESIQIAARKKIAFRPSKGTEGRRVGRSGAGPVAAACAPWSRLRSRRDRRLQLTHCRLGREFSTVGLAI